jgi:hypothetical protein
MTGELAARRYPASAFPEIQGVRLAPPGVAATLVNLSAAGVLVESASRLLPGTVLTVHFNGTFNPASIESRVVRCEVAGIATDGSLRLAFSTRIALPNEADDDVDARAAAPSAPPLAAAAAAAVAAAVAAPVLRNRW